MARGTLSIPVTAGAGCGAALVGVMVGLLMYIATPPALAANQGSEGVEGSGPGQTWVNWNADDIHAVWFAPTLPGNFPDKVRDVIGMYDGTTDLRMYQTTELSISRNDVRVYRANYGDNGYAAVNRCSISGRAVTGAHPTRSCVPVLIQFNNEYPHYYNSDPRVWAIVCHELGHSVSLRHAPAHAGSCVTGNSLDGISQLSAAEVGHINGRH